MQLLLVLSERVLKLSLQWRLRILVLVFLPCLALYTVLLPLTRNGTIIVIPIVLAAWFFTYRGFLLFMVVVTLIIVLIYDVMLRTVWWPESFVLLFIQGTASGLIVGLIVSLLRELSERLVVTRLKALTAEQAYQQQQQLNQAKDQLILHISHELRTPLTMVHGYLELLQEGRDVLDAESQALFRMRALEGCDELREMIETVMEAVQAERDTTLLRPERLMLSPLIQSVLLLIDPQQAQKFSFEVAVDGELSVWADKQRLRQVLLNLLSNALKYTPAHTRILIVASPYLDELAHVCISVEDQGPGIPLAEQLLLFQKFSRLTRDVNGAIRGLGMGLYISKQLVEAMGGRIWVESSGRPGEGSRFCFTLPASPAAVSDMS